MRNRNQLGGFRYAFAGIALAWRETNFKFHVASAIFVFALAWILHITSTEILLLMLSIGMVLTAEVLNTAIEEFCNHVTPEEHIHIANVKDLAAGAVFISACVAIAVGAVIFVPYLLALV